MIHLPGEMIFVHIPRTGGHSIYDAVLGGEREAWTSKLRKTAYRRERKVKVGIHAFASSIKTTVGSKEWGRCFTFAIVRPPEERMLSIWREFQRRNPEDKGEDINYEEMSFEQFVFRFCRTKGYVRPDLQPQWNFIADDENRILVNRVYRLQDGVQEIEHRLSEILQRPVTIPHHYGSTQPGDEVFITAKTRARMMRLHEDDYKRMDWTRRDAVPQKTEAAVRPRASYRRQLDLSSDAKS